MVLFKLGIDALLAALLLSCPWYMTLVWHCSYCRYLVSVCCRQCSKATCMLSARHLKCLDSAELGLVVTQMIL